MTRSGLIVLQAIGAASILPYPFILIANLMSIAAPGHTPATQLPWILLSFYPIVWIALYVVSWRAMARGAVGLAFGLSSIPALACVLVFALFASSWVGFGLGKAGIGNGGVHSTVISPHDPLIDAIVIAGERVQLEGAPASLAKALEEIEKNPDLINLAIQPHGSPLKAALDTLSVNIDGAYRGEDAGQQEGLLRLVHVLVDHGAHLTAYEAADLRTSWKLRRELFDGPVTTAQENPLVWRIVTHTDPHAKPFNPLTDQYVRTDTPPPFLLDAAETAMVNGATRLHGTPLYAALLDRNSQATAAIIRAGGRLSGEEARDPAAESALESVLTADAGLRAAYRTNP